MVLIIFCKKCKFSVALNKGDNGKCLNCGSHYYWDEDLKKHKIDDEVYEENDLFEYISFIVIGFIIIGLVLGVK
jgi:uncharacterized protein (DUF983 family)